MPTLTEPQTLLTQLIESTIEDSIDAIGTPTEADGKITVQFQYGDQVFDAEIDPEAGTLKY
jgi:hypothetical protein